MPSAQEEATRLLTDIVQGLFTPQNDLEVALRKCQHAAELLGWQAARDWFNRELTGYALEVERPWYRKVTGKTMWRDKGSFYDTYRGAIEKTVYGEDARFADGTAVLDVYANLDWIKNAAVAGYSELTGETGQRRSKSRDTTVAVEQLRVFQATAFSTCLKNIERLTFDWCSKTLAQLAYGDLISDVWTEHRRVLDSKLQELGLSGAFAAIESGLRSNTPESWRSAVLACRNLMHDVAAYLWRDPRSTYDLLPGQGAGEKLEVDDSKYLNRLAAYIHQKGLRGGTGRFLRKEIDRLDESFRALHSIQSAAKSEVIEIGDARSIAVWTYLMLGELVSKTDMQPIEQYGDPARPTD